MILLNTCCLNIVHIHPDLPSPPTDPTMLTPSPPENFFLNLHNNFTSSFTSTLTPPPPRLFLAHLSRRLIGELIVYPWSGVRPSSVRRPSVVCPQCSNIFFSETAWPILAKFYVEPPWVGGTKVCSRHLGHMTKMAATPIYGKNPSKIFFSRTGRRTSMKLGMYYRGLQPIIVCSNDDPGLTLTYFTARSNLVT